MDKNRVHEHLEKKLPTIVFVTSNVILSEKQVKGSSRNTQRCCLG